MLWFEKINLQVEFQVDSATFGKEIVYLIVIVDIEVDIAFDKVQRLIAIVILQVLFDYKKKRLQKRVLFGFYHYDFIISSFLEHKNQIFIPSEGKK